MQVYFSPDPYIFRHVTYVKFAFQVYDMISYLCGKQVPGIPINNPLPEDAIERAKQVYWQHSTLLTFLR